VRFTGLAYAVVGARDHADGLTKAQPTVVVDIMRELDQGPDQGRYLGGSQGAVGSSRRPVSICGSVSEFAELEQLARLNARSAPRGRIVRMVGLRLLVWISDERVGASSGSEAYEGVSSHVHRDN
jgi:hypothetical protein